MGTHMPYGTTVIPHGMWVSHSGEGSCKLLYSVYFSLLLIYCHWRCIGISTGHTHFHSSCAASQDIIRLPCSATCIAKLGCNWWRCSDNLPLWDIWIPIHTPPPKLRFWGSDSLDLDLQPPASCGRDPCTCKNKVKGQLVQATEWRQKDRHNERYTNFPANAVSN